MHMNLLFWNLQTCICPIKLSLFLLKIHPSKAHICLQNWYLIGSHYLGCEIACIQLCVECWLSCAVASCSIHSEAYWIARSLNLWSLNTLQICECETNWHTKILHHKGGIWRKQKGRRDDEQCLLIGGRTHDAQAYSGFGGTMVFIELLVGSRQHSSILGTQQKRNTPISIFWLTKEWSMLSRHKINC